MSTDNETGARPFWDLCGMVPLEDGTPMYGVALYKFEGYDTLTGEAEYATLATSDSVYTDDKGAARIEAAALNLQTEG